MLKPILALAIKDLRLLFRDKPALFFTFGLPLLFGIFFGTVFGGEEGSKPSRVPVVLVDEDRSERSAKFVAKLKGSPDFDLSEGELEAAAELVRKGQRTAYIRITKGFGDKSSFFWGDPAEIEVGVDPSRSIEAQMLEGIVTKHAFEQLSESFTNQSAMTDSLTQARQQLESSTEIEPARRDILSRLYSSLDVFAADLPKLQSDSSSGTGGAASDGAEPARGFEPVRVSVKKVEKPVAAGGPKTPRSSYAVSFPQGMIWAVLGCAAGFGIGLVIERTKGTLLRLRTSPLTWTHILLGKAVACFIATMLSMSFLMLIGVFVFGVRPDSTPLLILAMVCTALCFVGIMMLLSVLGRSEASAGGIGWAVCLVMALPAGGTVPLFILPEWMQKLASFSPVKWGIVAMEGGLWRGYSLGEMLLPCGILLAIGAAGFTIGSAVFRRLELA